jgi:hypothetical protein
VEQTEGIYSLVIRGVKKSVPPVPPKKYKHGILAKNLLFTFLLQNTTNSVRGGYILLRGGVTVANTCLLYI